MAVYPELPLPQFPLVIEPEWRTIVSSFDGGSEQRKAKWDYPRYNVNLQYNVLTRSEFDIVWNFYQARKGAYNSFYFFDVMTHTYDELYVGAGDGSTTIFDLPGKFTSEQLIYKDGQLQSSGYSILTGGGQGSADRVEFTAAPADGVIISCGFVGMLRIKCRFKEDKLSRELFSVALYTTGLEFTGLSGA